MIAVTAHALGAVLPVWAKAGARFNAMDEVREGALVVSVTAPPEDGKANAAIVDVLAQNLNLPRSRFQVVSGAGSRQKRILVEGIRPEDLVARIEAVLTPTIYDPGDPEV
jgi:uncharacterized protein (TIGR00251 family)